MCGGSAWNGGTEALIAVCSSLASTGLLDIEDDAGTAVRDVRNVTCNIVLKTQTYMSLG